SARRRCLVIGSMLAVSMRVVWCTLPCAERVLFLVELTLSSVAELRAFEELQRFRGAGPPSRSPIFPAAYERNGSAPRADGIGRTDHTGTGAGGQDPQRAHKKSAGAWANSGPTWALNAVCLIATPVSCAVAREW